MDKKKIILIDDDQINNYYCELLLNPALGVSSFKSFTNPLDALSCISELNIDSNTIILLDLNMPEMNGWEFLEKFEKTGLDGNVFILTSSTNPIDKELAIQKYPKVKGFFSKPLSFDNTDFIKELLKK